MILSITMNPTFDYVYFIDHLKIGGHNRFKNPIMMPGGKGINMSRAAASLGGNVIALATLAGQKGNLIYNALKKENFTPLKFDIEGESRNAITIMHDGSNQTEIVEQGPIFNEAYKQDFFNLIEKVIIKNDINVVTVNGSVNTENDKFYIELLSFIRLKFDNNVKVVFDISGAQLKNVYDNPEFAPDVIKPNEEEFKELFNLNDVEEQTIINCLNNSNSKIKTIIVSCGKDGAIVKNNNQLYKVSIPVIEVVNTTGSGDSAIGGLAYALDNNMDFINQIKFSMASGINNAQHQGVGEINKDEVENLVNLISVDKIN